MTAYILFQRESTEDEEALSRYAEGADTTFHGHDVQVLVDYGAFEVLEGPAIEGAVVLQFQDAKAAREWYFGKEYQEVVRDRFRGATYRAVLVDGIETSS